MSQSLPRDLLTGSRKGTFRTDPATATPTPGTELIGFDLTRLLTWSTLSTTYTGGWIYGPRPIYTVPDRGHRIVISGLAVQFDPEPMCAKVAWFLTVGQGGVQEYIQESLYEKDGVLQKIQGGRRWSYIGGLNLPEPVRIELRPGVELNLTAITHFVPVSLPLNIYVRLTGYSQAPRA